MNTGAIILAGIVGVLSGWFLRGVWIGFTRAARSARKQAQHRTNWFAFGAGVVLAFVALVYFVGSNLS